MSIKEWFKVWATLWLNCGVLKFIFLTPVLSQPETWQQVVTLQEKGNTFQAYHLVRGLEEPMGGQLTAQHVVSATTEDKTAVSWTKNLKWLIQRGGGECPEQISLRLLLQVQPTPSKQQCCLLITSSPLWIQNTVYCFVEAARLILIG